MEQPNNDTSYHYFGNFNLIVDYACRDWLVLIINIQLNMNEDAKRLHKEEKRHKMVQ